MSYLYLFKYYLYLFKYHQSTDATSNKKLVAILTDCHGDYIFVFMITSQFRVIERYLILKT